MKVIENFLTKNDCYRAGRTIVPRGIMVHSCGVAQPNAEVFMNSWNRSGVEVCVHAFVDGSGAVYQTLPWERRAWHAGGSANNTHISFEICEPAGHTYNGGTMVGYDIQTNAEYFERVYRSAAELCAMLCKEYALTAQDIICHSEGAALGIASNHADVMHWFPKHGKDMDDFRAEVDKLLKGETQMDNTPAVWAEEAVNWCVANGLLKGDANGDLMLHRNLTREEMCVLLHRFAQLMGQA